jgi:hypothetical protein
MAVLLDQRRCGSAGRLRLSAVDRRLGRDRRHRPVTQAQQLIPSPPSAARSFTEALKAPTETATADRPTAPENARVVRDTVTAAAIPAPDGTLATVRRTAEALARHAKADNTRRAYRAGVRAWCAWCRTHGSHPLPARRRRTAAHRAMPRTDSNVATYWSCRRGSPSPRPSP